MLKAPLLIYLTYTFSFIRHRQHCRPFYCYFELTFSNIFSNILKALCRVYFLLQSNVGPRINKGLVLASAVWSWVLRSSPQGHDIILHAVMKVDKRVSRDINGEVYGRESNREKIITNPKGFWNVTPRIFEGGGGYLFGGPQNTLSKIVALIV